MPPLRKLKIHNTHIPLQINLDALIGPAYVLEIPPGVINITGKCAPWALTAC